MKWRNDRKERSGAWRIKVTLMKSHAYSAPYGDLRLEGNCAPDGAEPRS
jgi:hypothetical protein